MKNKISSIFLLFAMLTALIPQVDAFAQTGSVTVDIQPDGASVKDTVIVQETSDRFGDLNVISAGEINTTAWKTRGLIEFDLSGLPRDVIVESASLELTVEHNYSNNARTMNVYPMNTSWGEDANWEWKTGFTTWQTAGASGTNDALDVPIGTVAVPSTLAAGDKVTITFTDMAAIAAMFKQNLFGFKLQMETEDNDLYTFYSSDDTTSTNRPKLTLTYTVTDADLTAGWTCVNVSPYGKCSPIELTKSPYTPFGTMGVENTNVYDTSENVSPQIAALLHCDPYPRCQNDYPIYYRFEYDVSWVAQGSTSANLWMRLSTNKVDTVRTVECGTGVAAKCRGFFEGVISISDLPEDYDAGFTIGVRTGLSYPSSWFAESAVTWTIYLSRQPFDENCPEIYSVPVPETYGIDPLLETPLGPTGTPADDQIYPTEIGKIYMVRVKDGPWNDGTTDRTDAAVSFDGVTWESWDSFSVNAVCIDLSAVDPENNDYRVIYFTATTETFYIRANDVAEAFGDNSNNPTTPYQYVIGEAILNNSGCPQFSYSEADLKSTISVPSTDDDVPVYDPQNTDVIQGGEWYGIKVTSGTWHENAPTTPRIDMEFKFMVFGPQQPIIGPQMPTWDDLAETASLVECASLDGTIVYVQAPLRDGLVLHLHVNDQDTPQNFSDNTGTLNVNIYHVTRAFVPTGCAADFTVDDIVASGDVQGNQVNGKSFANSFGSSSTGVSTSYYMTLGGWYMLETKDGPWTASSSSGPGYTEGDDYFGVQIKQWSAQFDEDWQAPDVWPLATCVVDIDNIGHQRIYFKVPDNAAEGGREFMLRVAGASNTTKGFINWDLYQAVDTTTSGGTNPWQTCKDNYGTMPQLNNSWIPVKAIGGTALTQYSVGGGSVALVTGKKYTVTTSRGPWQDGENPTDRYDAELSSDGGLTWFPMSEHPDVTCGVKDQLGQYQTAIIDVQVGQIWKIRVADSGSTIFTDNEGSLAYLVFESVYLPTYDPTDPIYSDTAFDACLPSLVRPAMPALFEIPDHIVPTTPSAWEVSDWVPYIGEWISSFIDFTGALFAEIGGVVGQLRDYLSGWIQYANRSMISYFAWCPRHMNILVVAIHKLEEKEPLASVRELETAADSSIAEVKAYDWGAGGEGGGLGDGYEDTSIFSFGGEGGGAGPGGGAVNNIVEKIFPTSGKAFNVWDGTQLIEMDSNTALPAYYYTCGSAFADYLPSLLRNGVCFASAYWKETGAAWWVQLSLDIGTVFLLIGMIKSSAQSLIYMMTGVRPWTKDGASRMIVEVAQGNSPVQNVEDWRSTRGTRR